MFDFKALKKLLEPPNAKKAWEAQWSYYVRRKKKGFNLTLKDVSDDFLNYSFGWKPFVSDLIAMYRALANLDKRLSYLVRNASRPIRRHVTIDLVDFQDWPSLDRWLYSVAYLYKAPYDMLENGHNSETITKRRWIYKPRYTQTLEYSYTLPNVSDTRRKIRAYLDAFGVRLDPSIIWNAIPFSFVVDWVIDVGGWLRRFTPNDLGMEIVIRDFSQSVKYHSIADITAELKYPSWHGYAIEKRDILSIERSYYERSTELVPMTSLSFTTPNAMQFTLGGALVLSNRKSKYKSKFGSR
jgi:hypothetical protein